METPTLDNSKETMKEQEKPSLFSRILGIFKKKQKKVPSEEEQKNQTEVTLTDEEKAKIEYEEYLRMKVAVNEYPRFFPWVIVFSITILIALLFAMWASYTFLQIRSGRILFAFSILLDVAIFGIVYIDANSFAEISDMREEIARYELSHAQDKTQEDPFQNSIKTSYTYLDRYYDQTQQQAKNGFRITMGVALFGAGLISVGVWLLFSGTNDKITPAYITCAAGVITEFISSIFFAMYNKTVTSMNSYHDKLVLSQNIAFALRVADSLTEKKKDAAKLEIIKELMKDVNAQMMKSDNDDAEPPKKKQSDAEKPSDAGTQA